MTLRPVSALLLATLAAACRSPRSEPFEAAVAAPPRPQPPGLEAKSGSSERPPAPVRLVEDAWVRIDLAAVLALSGADALEVLAARERLAEAAALQDLAHSRFLPDLRPGAQFAHHDGQIQATEGAFLDVTRQETAAGIRAELLLRLGEAIFDARAAARRVEAEEAGVEERTQAAMLDGALRYLDLIAAVEDVGISREALELSAGLSRLEQARRESGFAVPADVDRAAAQEAQDRVQAAESEAAFQAASIELARHLRLDPSVTLVPGEPGPVALPADTGEPLDALVRRALDGNPALRRAGHLAQAASELEDRAAIAPWIPTVGVGGVLSERGENPGRLGGAEDWFAMVGWEIRGFGTGTTAELRAAEARHRQARLGHTDVRERLVAAVVRTRAEIAARRQALEASDAAIAAARSSVERTRARLEQGQGLVVEMLEAQAALARARRARVRAVIGFDKSVLTLKALLGERPVP